jgi:ribonuclease HI
MAEQQHVTIYTDGACSGNPGPGGYAAVLIYGEKRRELSQGYRATTNNRMELLGVITALEHLTSPCKVTLYSDSEYVVNAITKGWLTSWQSRGWRKADKKPVLNVDLWKRLVPQLERHDIEFKWVRGHNNNVENERCDVLAVMASQSSDLLVDEGFPGEKKQEGRLL